MTLLGKRSYGWKVSSSESFKVDSERAFSNAQGVSWPCSLHCKVRSRIELTEFANVLVPVSGISLFVDWHSAQALSSPLQLRSAIKWKRQASEPWGGKTIQSLKSLTYLKGSQPLDNLSDQQDGLLYLRLHFSRTPCPSSFPPFSYFLSSIFSISLVCLGTCDLSGKETTCLWVGTNLRQVQTLQGTLNANLSPFPTAYGSLCIGGKQCYYIRAKPLCLAAMSKALPPINVINHPDNASEQCNL